MKKNIRLIGVFLIPLLVLPKNPQNIDEELFLFIFGSFLLILFLMLYEPKSTNKYGLAYFSAILVIYIIIWYKELLVIAHKFL